MAIKNYSKCWNCEKCCSVYKCKWVLYCSLLNGISNLSREEILLHAPNGVELDNYNNIISCPDFVDDGLSKKHINFKQWLKSKGYNYNSVRAVPMTNNYLRQKYNREIKDNE